VADDGPHQVSLVVDGTMSGVVTMLDDLPEHPDRVELVIRWS
jgi:hypothetical protein